MLSVFDPNVLQLQVTLWVLGVLSNGSAYDLTTVRPPSGFTMAAANSYIKLQPFGATKQLLAVLNHASNVWL